MKSIRKSIPIILATLLVPALSYAAGGGGASELVVVADTRIIESGILKYLADLYNTNITLFAVWCVVLTALYGSFLGFFMDFLMSKTGLDLTSRKIVEH
ncbi:MAG: hypothetical protein R6W92_00890 [Desulfocurvibacter africanus]